MPELRLLLLAETPGVALFTRPACTRRARDPFPCRPSGANPPYLADPLAPFSPTPRNIRRARMRLGVACCLRMSSLVNCCYPCMPRPLPSPCTYAHEKTKLGQAETPERRRTCGGGMPTKVITSRWTMGTGHLVQLGPRNRMAVRDIYLE